MSRNSFNENKTVDTSRKARAKTARSLLLSRHVLFSTLIMLLILGVVSISFAIFADGMTTSASDGALIFDVSSAVAEKNIAVTGSNTKTDLASTGADQSEALAPVAADASDDLAQAGADADLAVTGGYNWSGNIFFRAPDGWDLSTYPYVQAWAVQSTSASSGTKYAFCLGNMSIVGTTSNSKLYWVSVNASHGGWGATEYLAFTANTGNWNTGDFYISGCGHYTQPYSYGVTNSSGAYLFVPSDATNNTASNNNTISGSYNGTGRNVIKKTQDYYVYTDGSSSADGGYIEVSAHYMDGSNYSGSSAIANNTITVNSDDTDVHEDYDAVEGTKVTLTATTESGFQFDGFYDAATGGNLISKSSPATYYVFGTQSVYARFSERPVPRISDFAVTDDELCFGETATLSATKHNSSNTISYSSSDSTVVSVSGTTIKALKPGTATITASLTDAEDQELEITVLTPSVTLTYSNTNIKIGHSTVAPTVTFHNANASTAWKTGSPTYTLTAGSSIASIASTGIVTSNNTGVGSTTPSVSGVIRYNNVDYTISATAASSNVTISSYYVATGDTAFPGGASAKWTANDANFFMKWDSTNSVYYYETAALNSETPYQYKITDGTWDHSWPNDNKSATVDHTGDYLRITYNTSGNAVNHTKKHPTYTITLNRNSGSYVSGYTAPSTYSCGDASATTLPTESNIKRTGYDFLGWFTSNYTADQVKANGYTPVTSIDTDSTGNKTYYAVWRAQTPIIDTFKIDSSSSKSMQVNGTATLQATYRYPGANRVVFSASGATAGSVSISTPAVTTSTDSQGRTVYTSTATLTALKPDTSVTITASLVGAEDNKTVTATIAEPSISNEADVSLYVDQSSGVSAAVNATPTGTISYASADTSVFTVSNAGLITPVAVGPVTGDATPGTVDPGESIAPVTLNISVYYNASYTATYTRDVYINPRPMYVLGLKNEHTWTVDNSNKMIYDRASGLYYIVRNLYPKDTYYGGSSQINADDTGFKLYDASTPTDNYERWYGGGVDGYTINGMAYNNPILVNPDGYNRNLRIHTESTVLDPSRKIAYKFYFAYSARAADTSPTAPDYAAHEYKAKQLYVYYPKVITYHANGHGTDPDPVGVVYGDSATAPTVSPVTGYNFIGWYKEPACTNVFNFATELIVDNIDLYAKWEAKTSALTFDLNNVDNYNTALHGTPTGTLSTNLSGTYGSAMPTAAVPNTFAGYEFQGYFDARNGGTQYYNADGTSKRNWDKNIETGTTLYAHWAPKTSALTFSKNTVDTDGQTLAQTPSGTMTTGKTGTYGHAMPTGIARPTLTGYDFAGFYDSATGGTKYYNADGTSAHVWDKDTKNGITLYAHWNIHTFVVKMQPVHRDEDSTYAYDSSVSVPTLTAAYSVISTSYTDTLIASAFTSSSSHKIRYGSSVTLTAGALSGYTFDGIYSDVNGGSRLDTTTAGSLGFTQGNAQHNYYARYTKTLGVDLTVSGTADTMSTLTLSAAASGGVDDYTYTFSYEYSSDNGSTWGSPENIESNSATSSTTYSPTKVGQYRFTVTVTSSDGTITYTESDNEIVTVTKPSIWYSVSTVPASGSVTAGVSVAITGVDKTGASEITYNPAELTGDHTNKIQGGDGLRVSVTRPSNEYYIASLTVTMGSTTLQSLSNHNGDKSYSESQLTPCVGDDIVVTYDIRLKPKITFDAGSYINTHSLTYTFEGASQTQTTPGTYPVDYNSDISYTVTLSSANADLYYIKEITATDDEDTSTVISSDSSPTSLTGSKSGVTENYTLAADIQNSPTVSVVQPQYGSIYVTSGSGDNIKYYINGDPVRYGTTLTIHVFPNRKDRNYRENDSMKFYVVGNVMKRAGSAAEASSIGAPTSVSGNSGTAAYLNESYSKTDTITADSEYSVNITYFDGYNSESYGGDLAAPEPLTNSNKIRIFFTDNNNWYAVHDQLYVHYVFSGTAPSTESTDYVIAQAASDPNDPPVYYRNVEMHRFYQENYSGTAHFVYYADIPNTATYVSFNTGETVQIGDTDDYTAATYSEYKPVIKSGEGVGNAYSSASGNSMTSELWQCSYADYNTVPTVIPGEGEDPVDTVIPDTQQAYTSVNRAAVFRYTYDFDENESLTATLRYGDACDVNFHNGRLSVTPSENDEGYSLIEVKSLTSGNVKYYLIKINEFELRSFESLQRLYNTNSVSSLIFKTVARAASADALTYAYSYSAHNNDDYTSMTGATENSQGTGSLVGYIIQKLTVTYSTYNFKGVQYFKTDVAEADGDLSDSRTDKVVFDIDGDSGSGVLYFKRSANWNMANYRLVAEFSGDGVEEWVTLQRVGAANSLLYRVMIPEGSSSVRFYLMYKDRYTVDDTVDYDDYYYAATTYWTGFEAGDMFEVEYIDDDYAIRGDFVPFSN